MNEKATKVLEKFVEDIQAGSVSKEEFTQAFRIFISILKELKDNHNNKISEMDSKLSSSTFDYAKRLEKLENNISEISVYVDSKGKENIDGLKKELLSIIDETKSLIPDIEDLNPVYEKIEEVKTRIPELPKELEPIPIRNKLESIEEEEEKLKIEAIRNLRKELNEIKEELKKKPNMTLGGIAGRDIFKDIDISTQLDGSTKTFNIPSTYRIITVDLSSFPYGSLRKNIDYTYTSSSITFTDNIDAPTQLAVGQSCILTVVTG